MADGAEGYAQACRQSIEILVYRPEPRVRGEQNGGEQRHVYGAATGVMALLSLDQGKYLVGCRDDGLLQFPDIAERALARCWWRSAS